jgi:hypothetical protein
MAIHANMRPSPSAPGHIRADTSNCRHSQLNLCRTVRTHILLRLRQPGHYQYPVIHDRMHDLRLQREAAEAALTHILLDRTPDSTLVNPKLFSETEYQRLETLISDLNRAMYVIYAQFLDMNPSLTCKAPANSNLAPERDRSPYTCNEFHSPGSYMEDSGLEYATSRAHTIITAAQSQREPLIMVAPPSTRQSQKRPPITLGLQMSANRPLTYRRTYTNDDTHSAPPPIVDCRIHLLN